MHNGATCTSVQANVGRWLHVHVPIHSQSCEHVRLLRNVAAGGVRRSRPKSLAISTPTKLLSLEEAREHMLQSTGQAPGSSPKQKYIEVGGGPANLPTDYHTVIELPNKCVRARVITHTVSDYCVVTSQTCTMSGTVSCRCCVFRKKSRKSRKSAGAAVTSSSSSTAANQQLGATSSSSWKHLFSRGSKNLKKQGGSSEDLLTGACASERQVLASVRPSMVTTSALILRYHVCYHC